MDHSWEGGMRKCFWKIDHMCEKAPVVRWTDKPLHDPHQRMRAILWKDGGSTLVETWSWNHPDLPSSACHHFLCDDASYQPSLPMGKIEKYHVPLRTDDGAKWHQEYLLLVTGGKEVSSGKSVISSTEVEQVSISLVKLSLLVRFRKTFDIPSL